jgi:uncharacterized membrane protein
MFTILAIALGVVATFWMQYNYRKERNRLRALDSPDDFSGKRVRESIVFARQDLMLIVGVLTAILLMLGIIADRIH